MTFSDRIARANSAAFNRFAEHVAILAPGQEAPVIYDAPFRLESVYEGHIETSAPACSMADADVAVLDIAHGSRITVKKNGAFLGDFEVIGVEPDGMGLTRLVLTKDP
ncbi:MAG TPA: hypothetical protein DCP69_03395 [Candidatus Omnitrophica bacterium]|nr:hypothetical protein [Candidatus Omnitrophota bacterium]